MAQVSVTAYFNQRKRAAADQIKSNNKVLILDPENTEDNLKGQNIISNDNEDKKILFSNTVTHKLSTDNDLKLSNEIKSSLINRSKVVTKLSFDDNLPAKSTMSIKKTLPGRVKTLRKKTGCNSVLNKQQDIQEIFRKIEKKNESIQDKKTDDNDAVKGYPTTPTKKISTMDRIASGENNGLSLSEIKSKLSRSNRLAELKASMTRFSQRASKIDELEKKAQNLSPGSGLKSFKTIDLEVPASPNKILTPEKQYLSPTKVCLQSPRKVLFGLASPKKNSSELTSPTKYPAYQKYANLVSPVKPSLTLPYKYRCLAEIFKCVDTVCAMFFNRKETITFKKLKPAVQEMLRKNFTEKHLAQIKFVYPDSYSFSQEKMRNYGSTSKQDKYQFVILPLLPNKQETEVQSTHDTFMSPSILLERQRNLFKLLIEKVKGFHEEFLMNLDPPMLISRDKLTRWHPEFDIEQVPDIEIAPLPEPPNVEKLTSAKDVLLAAKNLFNCNTRMERALQKLSEMQEKRSENTSSANENIETNSKELSKSEIKNESTEKLIADTAQKVAPCLKGIPKSLLEKVRARQAAKALESMTRTPQRDKEISQYSRLPDLSKLTRNIFVTEKKGVLPIDFVIGKLNNSYRGTLNKVDLEEDLKLLSKLLPGWLTVHEVRKTVYLKVSKDADMTKVLSKLEKMAEQKASG